MPNQPNKLQKLILPVLLIIIVAMLFFNYFLPSNELGDFSKLDANSHASVEIITKFVKEKGITRNGDGTIFYVTDVKNREIMVSGPGKIPPGMDEATSITLTGHLTSKTNFHAHGLELRN